MIKKILKETIPYIVIFIVVVIIRTFIITPVTVVGDSMVPTLHDKELLLLSKISYKIHIACPFICKRTVFTAKYCTDNNENSKHCIGHIGNKRRQNTV